MILRVLRGRGSRDDIVALEAALARVAGEATAERAGPAWFRLGWRRAEGLDREVVVVSHWSSAEAATKSDANQTSPVAFARQHVGDIELVHFEVDDTIRGHSTEEPVAIRIATGRFSRPGADREMQDLLRERAPRIGAEMAEAWVGRRLTGRDVEVTFVSAWRRLPEDRRLDDAFWPDIALRYDQFVVEVYSTLGVE